MRYLTLVASVAVALALCSACRDDTTCTKQSDGTSSAQTCCS